MHENDVEEIKRLLDSGLDSKPVVHPAELRKCDLCGNPIPASETMPRTRYHGICRLEYQRNYNRLHHSYSRRYGSVPTSKHVIKQQAQEDALVALEDKYPQFHERMQVIGTHNLVGGVPDSPELDEYL